jgi:hypothetical protein
MALSIAEHMGQALTLVYAHVLTEIIVATEIFPTSVDGALVRCNTKSQQKRRERGRKNNSRFSLVWIDRTCRFKCSPRAKHL